MSPTTETPPKLSIGLPVYNGEKYIERSICSILSQDFTDFELIICDNQSTDRTAEICARYAEADPRVRYVRNPVNLGAAPNHNRVFELARGEFFKWCAHDDTCEPTMLRRCMDEISRSSASVALVYPYATLIDAFGNPIRQYPATVACASDKPHVRLAAFLRNIHLSIPMYGVIRSSALRQTRWHGSYLSADYVMLAELALVGQFVEINESLLNKRIHAERSTQAFKTLSDHLAWFDSRNAGRRAWLSPRNRLFVEYLKGIWRLPFSIFERLLCSFEVLRCYLVPSWRRSIALWIRSIKSHRSHASDAAGRDAQGDCPL